MFLLGGGYDEFSGEPMGAKTRAAVFFLVSVALLVIYGIQQSKFTTIIGIWIVVTIIGTLISFGRVTELIADSVLILMGLSVGMVLSNTTIQLV